MGGVATQAAFGDDDMIIKENSETATIAVCRKFIDLLKEYNVFTREQDSECRWRIGEEVTFGKQSVLEPYIGIYRGNTICSIGSFTYSHSPLAPTLTIGRYCSIAGGLRTSGARHPIEAISTSPVFYDTRVSFAVRAASDLGFNPKNEKIPNEYKPAPIIENDVWIAADCTINAGVQVGNGSVIARSSSVVKSIFQYEIHGGNPAKKIKDRFSPSIIKSLSALEWWKFSPAQLNEAPKSNPAMFIEWLQFHIEALEPFRPKTLHLWQEVKSLYR